MTTTNSVKSFEARELHLKAVTVFTDRAEVVREFSVDLGEGLTDVVVNNVAATLDSRSIQVSASGTTIHKVEFKKNNAKSAQEDTPKVKELLAEKKTLQSKLESKKRQKQAYNTHLEMLNNIVTNVPLHNDTDVMDRSFGSLEELLGFHVEQVGRVDELLQGVDAEIAELEPQLQDRQEQISKARSSEANQKSIVITLESATKAKVRMELTYQVTDAWWSPSYDLRVTSDPTSPTKKHAKLHYFANIQQASGEDWNAPGGLCAGARDAQREAASPREAPFKPCGFIDRGGPPPGSMDPEDEEPTKFNEMRVEKHALSSTFKVPQKTSIPSDSSEHTVTIASLEFDLLVGLECFPYATTDVFETASALNNSNYPLLRGPAAVYLDHKFMSDTTIHAAAIGEKFVFTLGMDSDVKVKYTSIEPFRKQKSSTWLFDKNILVKNLKANEKILVTIDVQVPKSTDSRIKIELLAPAKTELVAAEDANTLKPPAIGPRLSVDNFLDWTVELNAGKERELVVEWSVQAPADETVEYFTRACAADRSDE